MVVLKNKQPLENYHGQHVRLYRNLTYKTKVIMSLSGYIPDKKGFRVIGHVTEATLKDVVFYLNPRERCRAIKEGRRNVHAWAEGIYLPDQKAITTLPLYYNHNFTDQFHVYGPEGNVVYRCRWLTFDGTQTLISSDAVNHPKEDWADIPSQLTLLPGGLGDGRFNFSQCKLA